MSETIGDIVAAHRSGAVTPEQTIRRSYARIRAHSDPAVFITLRDEEDAVAEARALAAAGPDGKPLYGVPLAVKDNIDVAGLPTTAACPAFAHTPGADATAVTRARLFALDPRQNALRKAGGRRFAAKDATQIVLELHLSVLPAACAAPAERGADGF